jgi:hypothetical protein
VLGATAEGWSPQGRMGDQLGGPEYSPPDTRPRGYKPLG